jgi:hypothetical protein
MCEFDSRQGREDWPASDGLRAGLAGPGEALMCGRSSRTLAPLDGHEARPLDSEPFQQHARLAAAHFTVGEADTIANHAEYARQPQLQLRGDPSSTAQVATHVLFVLAVIGSRQVPARQPGCAGPRVYLADGVRNSCSRPGSRSSPGFRRSGLCTRRSGGSRRPSAAASSRAR